MGTIVEMSSIVPNPRNLDNNAVQIPVAGEESNKPLRAGNLQSVAQNALSSSSSATSLAASTPSAISDQMVAVKVDSKEKVAAPQAPRYESWQLKMNAAVVCGLIALQSVLNRSLGEDSIGAKASNIGASLLVNCVASSAVGKIQKANWREQSDLTGQFLSLGAFSLFAFSMDVATCFAFGRANNAVFGEATLLQLMTSLGLVAKMGAAALLGKHTYALGDKSSTPDPKTKNWRLGTTMGLVFGLSAINTLINHMYSAGSVTSVLCNLAFSSAFGKVVKTQMKNEKPEKTNDPEQLKKNISATKWKRAELMGLSSLVGMVPPVLMALSFLGKYDDEGKQGWAKAFSLAYFWLGPTVAMICSQDATNLSPRISQGLKEETKAAKEDKFKLSNGQIAKYGASSTLINAAVSASHFVIETIFGGSPTAAMVAKQCESGWDYALLRKITMAMNSGCKQVAFLAGALGVTTLIEGAFIPFNSGAQWSEIMFRPTVAIFSGVVASLCGKYFRNYLVPKPAQKKW